MRVIELETVQLSAFPNLLYVLVHTDEGVTGLGETFLGADSVAAWIHENAAPYLLGKDPLAIEAHWHGLRGFVGINASSTENRGRSAIDIALWDLYGKVTGQPLYQLLGGAVRDSIPVYNTCAGPHYARDIPIAGEVSTNNWQLPQDAAPLPYEDMQAFLERPDALARDLLDNDITGMKMWPFDLYVPATMGHYISDRDVQQGVELFRRIRSEVGLDMDVMVDFHTNWDLPSAQKIARALEEVSPAWIEDPVSPDDISALAAFTASTPIPVAAGETLATRWSFKEVLNRRAVDILMCDPVWVGGVSEARRVANMAEAYQVPVTMHDCNGPVQFSTSLHLSCHLPNAYVQESVRAYYLGWYGDIAVDVPKIVAGRATPLSAPGHGIQLQPDLFDRPGTSRRSSTLKETL